ncbi:MAG: V-type ATPase subunit [Christensenellales bacterium]|jgi:vacuolar-type H+-ATPase subunit C/Vma6|nr:V-type ATPase subunit [Clostridiales bacterium]
MKDILFSNAVAVSKIDKLLSVERLYRIAESLDLESAVKILLENNYGGGIVLESYSDFEKLLQAETNIIDVYAKENIPLKTGIECFFLFSDYHNIKVLLKSYFEKKDFGYLLDDRGIYSTVELKDKIWSDKPLINPFIDDLIVKIKGSYEEITARDIDVKIDIAMLDDIRDRISKPFVSKYVKEYFENFINYTNIINLVRVIKAGGNYFYFKSLFIKGGKYDIHIFEEIFEDNLKVKNILLETAFEEYKDTIFETPLDELERLKEYMLMKNISIDKNDLLTDAPSLAFYLEKINEINVLRYILICLKNNVDKEQIRKRIRRLYD